MRCGRVAFWFAISIHLTAVAAAPKSGNLFIIGGGLRPDNSAVFQRMIELAGGREHARFVLFPTAAKSESPARQVGEIFVRYGISADRVVIVDLMLENAARQAYSPEIVERIRRSTGAFFAGGDQSRITRSLLNPDGSATPVLLALREMWHRGGVIAGSSAGAAMQSSQMLSASGLPDESLDEGMDALDFGIRRDLRHRGLLVTQGLGFFPAGIVDQHFSQYRGRLGRLARALINEHIRFGFGVDENTAMLVSDDGQIEVVGTGNLTVLDAMNATCHDGPLGCCISGVRLSCLQTGDRVNSASGIVAIRPEKTPIKEGSQDFSGNQLITDIAGPGAMPWAVVFGLAENSSRKQEGITLRYNQQFGHGYHFTLAKTEKTIAYGGYVDHFYSYAVDGVRLNIAPVLASRQDPQDALPIDLPADSVGDALKGLWFRGVLLADNQRRIRPREPLLRVELANALAQSVHLTMPRQNPPQVRDLPPSAELAEDIVKVVAAGLMKLDSNNRFRPNQAVTRIDAAHSLVHLAERCGLARSSDKPVLLNDDADLSAADREVLFAAIRANLVRLGKENRLNPTEAFSRQEAAEALYRVIDFSW